MFSSSYLFDLVVPPETQTAVATSTCVTALDFLSGAGDIYIRVDADVMQVYRSNDNCLKIEAHPQGPFSLP